MWRASATWSNMGAKLVVWPSSANCNSKHAALFSEHTFLLVIAGKPQFQVPVFGQNIFTIFSDWLCLKNMINAYLHTWCFKSVLIIHWMFHWIREASPEVKNLRWVAKHLHLYNFRLVDIFFYCCTTWKNEMSPAQPSLPLLVESSI